MKRASLAPALAAIVLAAIAGCSGHAARPAATRPASSPAADSGRALPRFGLPPLAGLRRSGRTRETIVVRPGGAVDTYHWVPGGAARAEYIATAGGVAMRTWTLGGRRNGRYLVSCYDSNGVAVAPASTRSGLSPTINYGTMIGACTDGHVTPLGYAEGFARYSQLSFVVVRS